MSQWLGRSRALKFVLAGWAVTASVVALWDLAAAVVVSLAGASCFAVAFCLAERQWWKATAAAAWGGSVVLNLVTAGNHSRVEHDVVFGVSLAALAYCVAVFAADRRTRSRRDKPCS